MWQRGKVAEVHQWIIEGSYLNPQPGHFLCRFCMLQALLAFYLAEMPH